MKVRKNIFWGVLCVAGAVALVVNKRGYLQETGFGSIIFSIILLGGFINGIIMRSWGEILFSAAFFIIINDQLLHLESLTPWTVLGVACLGTLGLNLLIPIKHKEKRNKWIKESGTISTWEEQDELMITEDGEVVQQDVVFGNSVKYIKSKELSGINADCVFGEISIYLTEAAKISTDVVFGHVHIYVPAKWMVTTNMDTVFGEILVHYVKVIMKMQGIVRSCSGCVPSSAAPHDSQRHLRCFLAAIAANFAHHAALSPCSCQE